MHCPNCLHPSTSVQDTRSLMQGSLIKRRRKCTQCRQKFITIERAQKIAMVVIKNDNIRESFNTEKITKSLYMVMRKRPFNTLYIDRLITEIIKSIENRSSNEISVHTIALITLKHLRKTDMTAYIRYAASHMPFESLEEFVKFCQSPSNISE
ncbi:MAG: ATP cone domain-containing protein [Alphaproteobacteria bacterium]|nr:ATP cone domain-containing protein [Alphaproteobacteria bacterium]